MLFLLEILEILNLKQLFGKVNFSSLVTLVSSLENFQLIIRHLNKQIEIQFK